MGTLCDFFVDRLQLLTSLFIHKCAWNRENVKMLKHFNPKRLKMRAQNLNKGIYIYYVIFSGRSVQAYKTRKGSLGHACFTRRFAKGWFPKGWLWRMFPSTNKTERRYIRMSPVPKKERRYIWMFPGTKTGTRVRSPKPPFYETALLFPLELCTTFHDFAPFCTIFRELLTPHFWSPHRLRDLPAHWP